MEPFTITSTVQHYPTLPYEKIKNDILGKKYILSVGFVGTKRAQKYNEQYRNKSYTPNVLSFPLSLTTGEIIITPSIAKTEARKFSMTPDGYIGYLFIHGCLHLKGMDHGATMDKAEARYTTKYGFR